MNWVKKQKLPAIEAIQYNGHPCIRLENLWHTLHSSFNSGHKVDLDLLREITSKPTTKWNPFSKEEFTSAIVKCNNLLTPGSDKLLWKHLKRCVKDTTCLRKFIEITNACIELGH